MARRALSGFDLSILPNAGETVVSPARSRIFKYDIAKKTLTKVPNTKGYDWAPSVTENGTVYFERTGARCGSNPRIMRYQQTSTPTTVVQLPSGIDMSSSYVFPLSDGRIQVLHDRIRCSNLRFGDDIYRFVDDFTVTVSVTIVGSGSVTSSPAGIDCSPTCSHEFEPQHDGDAHRPHRESDPPSWAGAIRRAREQTRARSR